MEGSGFGGDLESLRVSVPRPGGRCPTVWCTGPRGGAGPGCPSAVLPTQPFCAVPCPGPQRLPRPPRAPRRPRPARTARPFRGEQLGHPRTCRPARCAWAGRAFWAPRPSGKACRPSAALFPIGSTGNGVDTKCGSLFLSGPKPPTSSVLPRPCRCSPHPQAGGSCLWALGGRRLVVLAVTLGDTQRLSAGASLTGSGWPHCPGNVWPTRVCRTSEPGRPPAPGTGDGGLAGAHGCRCCDGHSEQACVRFARSRGVSLSASQKEEGRRTFTPEHRGPGAARGRPATTPSG